MSKEKKTDVQEAAPVPEKDATVLDLTTIGITDDVKLNGKSIVVDVADLPKGIGPHPTPAMIKSVKSLGVVHPVILTEENGKYAIVDGIRRVLAARAAGIEKINARVLEADSTMSSLLTLVSNQHRAENPHAEGKALMALLGKSDAEEAEQLRTVAAGIGLDFRKATGIFSTYKNLTPAAKNALRSGKLPAYLAKSFGLLSEAAQAKLLEYPEVTLASIKGQKSRARREKKAVALVNALRSTSKIAENEGRPGLARVLSDMANDVEKNPRAADQAATDSLPETKSADAKADAALETALASRKPKSKKAEAK